MALIRGVAHVRVFVRPKQWDAARAFYGKTLGMKCVDAETGIFSFPDGRTLGIERVGPKDREDGDLVGRLLAVSFQVADMARAYRRLSGKGVRFHRPPERQPWGGTLAFLDDPAGNILTLVQYP